MKIGQLSLLGPSLDTSSKLAYALELAFFNLQPPRFLTYSLTLYCNAHLSRSFLHHCSKMKLHVLLSFALAVVAVPFEEVHLQKRVDNEEVLLGYRLVQDVRQDCQFRYILIQQ
jgi:hypothetical protein